MAQQIFPHNVRGYSSSLPITILDIFISEDDLSGSMITEITNAALITIAVSMLMLLLSKSDARNLKKGQDKILNTQNDMHETLKNMHETLKNMHETLKNMHETLKEISDKLDRNNQDENSNADNDLSPNRDQPVWSKRGSRPDTVKDKSQEGLLPRSSGAKSNGSSDVKKTPV